MDALIDGDIVCYRVAWTSDEEEEKVALWRIDELVDRICDTIQADSSQIFLTGGGNFRKKIYPEYKANRSGKPKPKHLQACRDYLIKKYDAVVSEGCEADDLLGVEQCRNESSVICSIDKDLLMIPGNHYNFVKETLSTYNELDSLQHFYKQLLIGDTSDNVKGVDKIGEVKAGKLIDPIKDEEEMFIKVRELYKDDHRFLTNCNVLWIWRKQFELFSVRSKPLLEKFFLDKVDKEIFDGNHS
jgi:hypothetical protein